MTRIIILLSVLTGLLYTRCQETKHSKEETTSVTVKGEPTFTEYIEKLTKIHLPFTSNSAVTIGDELIINKDTTGFSKYKARYAYYPYGILHQNKDIVVLMDYSHGDGGSAIWITSYDKNGNKIDSLHPYKKSGCDMGYCCTEYVTIHSNYKIVVIDSTITFKINEAGNDIIPESSKLTVDTAYYQLNEEGRFIETQ